MQKLLTRAMRYAISVSKNATDVTHGLPLPPLRQGPHPLAGAGRPSVGRSGPRHVQGAAVARDGRRSGLPGLRLLRGYEYRTRRLFKCKGCGKQFSVTSGTTFHGRKLAIRDYLMAIAIFANAAKGTSALQLGRDLDVSYKTAFVLAHKLREAMGADQAKYQPQGPCRDRRRLLRRPPQAGQLQGQPGRPPPSRAPDRQAQGRGRDARAPGPDAAVRGQGRG